LLRIGKHTAGADRKIRLPANTAALFDKAVKAKPASARADGKGWDKDSWKWPVKAAAQAAKLPHIRLPMRCATQSSRTS
jgi:hypothetical protein